LTDDTLENQRAVINEAFNPRKISFKSAGIDLVVRPEWADNCREKAMKTSLRKDTYADLNVYFHPEILRACDWTFHRPNGVLGATVAYPFKDASSGEMLLDRVHIRADVVPGGNLRYFNQGATLVHEVRHWLGRTYHCRACDWLSD
jgi:hypothetical protein